MFLEMYTREDVQDQLSERFKSKIYGVNVWMKSVGFDRKRKGHIYFDEVTYN